VAQICFFSLLEHCHIRKYIRNDEFQEMFFYYGGCPSCVALSKFYMRVHCAAMLCVSLFFSAVAVGSVGARARAGSINSFFGISLAGGQHG
jgi:hypothetical protein